MDIYDGADWTEMDIDGLRADMESSSSIKEAAEFLCRSRSTDDVARRCEELGLKPKLRKRRMRSRGTGCPATMASTPMALPRPKQTISLNVPAAIKGSTCATSVQVQEHVHGAYDEIIESDGPPLRWPRLPDLFSGLPQKTHATGPNNFEREHARA